MGRTINAQRSTSPQSAGPQRPKPVRRIELKDEHTTRRLVLTFIFLGIGVGFLVYAFMAFLSPDNGWTEISANAESDEISCSEDFVFLYELGASSDMSSSAENKLIRNLYTQTAIEAYKIFDVDHTYTDVNNICLINQNPNELIRIDPFLYESLKLVQESGDRQLFLGPAYEYSDNIFYCEDDSQTVDFDPRVSSDAAEYYADIEAFAEDPDSISLEFFDNYEVRLVVSDEYRAFAEENGIDNYIDFYWMKNAFIVDYFADTFISYGYTHGSFSSYDGFIRNMDDRGESFSFGIYHREGNDVYEPAIYTYTGENSIVFLRNYMMSDQDTSHYYEMRDGEILTAYLDYDGYCRSSINELVAYSDDLSCARVVLSVSPLYIADEFDVNRIDELAKEGIYSIYTEDGSIVCSEPGLTEVNEDGIVYLSARGN